MPPILLIPGITNSGPTHWQSLWELHHHGVSRIQQDNWEFPVCNEWVAKIEKAVEASNQPPLLVAHSLGCLAFIHWLAISQLDIAGCMLVAIPNPEGPNFPQEAVGFAPLPEPKRHCAVLAISSTDDPFSDAQFTAGIMQKLRAKHVSVGAKGHINAQSGIGDWPEGWLMLSDHFQNTN